MPVGRKWLGLLAGGRVLFGWRSLDLLILVPLLARLDLLVVICRCGLLALRRLSGRLFGRCRFDLLLLVALLPARFLLFGRGGLFGWRCFDLLLVALLPARFLLFSRGGLFGRG
ncbi:conserved membrane hypothetical protein [Mesorhizobium prunaredense]|uniref:Uncharacterized protein n=1 Tax=Mesorhizobium prunaredense TaxID=1631249 RepID=A0A1R3V9K8_9HYPH|nr:conserved membrane hypothetical protein [Mesorhizobium prunaredense]